VRYTQPRCRYRRLRQKGQRSPASQVSLQGQEVLHQIWILGDNGRGESLALFLREINSQPSTTVKIPEIYRAFETRGRTYIIIEYIHIVGYASDGERANAVAQLVSVEPPSGAELGPTGGGTVKHRFFVDSEASRRYSTVDEMQTYINNVWFALSHVSFCVLMRQ
jgi:hypothetical protein